MERSLTLPIRPRLRPGTEVVSVDRGKMLLRSFSGTTMLSGEFVESGLPELLPLLNGTVTVEDVVTRLRGDQREQFHDFLFILMEKGFLCSGDEVGVDADRMDPFATNGHAKAYWSIYGRATNDAVSRIRSSTVMIVNLGGVGISTTRALAMSGVGRIVALDPSRVRTSDEIFGYQKNDAGNLRVDALAAYIAGHEKCNFVPIAESMDSVSDLGKLVSDADVVVVCGDNMSLAAYDMINEACIQNKTPWVSARIDRSRGIIGPFVVPEQTACFTCFELRNRANAEHPSDHEAIYRHWRNTDGIPDDWPAIPPFANIVGNHLALDVQRVLAGHLSAFLGRVFYIDLNTCESHFHEVLKLPRCPACSRGRERPLTKVWDIRAKAEFSAPRR